ncbi:nitrate- and nitrite sensing domain-containing protein [Streptomyces capparidis]
MALLVVPLVSLVSLWAFTSVDAVRDVMGLMDTDEVHDAFGSPLERSLVAIQNERRQAMLYLADPERPGAADTLRRTQDVTDTSVRRLRESADDAGKRSMLTNGQRASLDQVTADLDKLDELRGEINTRSATRVEAFTGYTRLIDPGYGLFNDLGAVDNNDLSKHFDAMVELARAREAVTREDALVTAALAAGEMSQTEFRALSAAVAEQRLLHRMATPELPSSDREEHAAYTKGNGKKLQALEEDLLDAGAAGLTGAVTAEKWRQVIEPATKELDALTALRARTYSDRSGPYELQVNLYAAVVGLLGLTAVIASVAISVRVGRGLVRDLTSLRKAALELSGTRLPRVMRRLAAGEELDVSKEAPDLEVPPGEDEISQVGQAFNDVQRAAVEAAVKQAELRRGISEVFVNLARRSQVLLHRQLTLLDAMERRTEDAEELADLFRLDHMTTRMRRHAEGLVILSGAAPARAWRNPVQLVNVIRAAVAEVEDYERVEVRRVARVSVSGPAVGDVTHLLAELIENATVFSPPHTQVQVHGERVANGFVLEIDDRGLGMSTETLLEANQRLAETPEFELSDTDRLGLFVVSRLARRHSVRVSLRPSPYGGTTAVVLLPNSILTDESSSSTGEQRVPRTGEVRDPHATEAPVRRTEAAFREWGLNASDERLPGDREPDRHDQATDPVRADADAEGDVPSLPRRRRPRSPVLVADHGRPVDRQPRPAPGAPEPPEQPAERPGRPGGPERNDFGLPKRVRQASLAPQLRAGRADAPQEESGTPVRERSAEEVRSRMASFQRGFQRGREVADPGDPDNGDTANRTDGSGDPVRQAPGTSTERDGR